MAEEPAPKIYQIHTWIREISPMIWRRLLVRSDSTIADLHHILQIAFGWTDSHLHRFHIRGQDYGIWQMGGPLFSTSAHHIRLADFHFRVNERFLYEYDFGDRWQHEIRVERHLALDANRTYPVCTGGKRAAPPEDCGGAWAYLRRRDEAPGALQELLWELAEDLEAGNGEATRARWKRIASLRPWLEREKFDRRAVNRRLRQYATGDENWWWDSQGVAP